MTVVFDDDAAKELLFHADVHILGFLREVFDKENQRDGDD